MVTLTAFVNSPNRIPFYWEVKTLFLLFLSLPQIQGSTFIYTNYLQPFFAKNETQIDDGIVSIQNNTFAFLQAKLGELWQFVAKAANKTPANGQAPAAGPSGQQSQAPFDAALGLFRTYAPAFLSAAQGGNRAPAASPVPTPSMTPSASSTSIPSVSAYSRPSPSPSAFQDAPPPFPEPVHHQ
ncbi:hypothetical protein V5O48_003393 [Marasmius crinis-equi]|uniref:Protein YOP1 n=1 Tax=Marasmius crinis-equi TaxID=585013 RepID=A0ABR3FU11_9AGAR